MATYFRGSLPSPRTDGFHAAVREFEAAWAENRHPSDRALADAASEFADMSDQLHMLLYGSDDAYPEQSSTLTEIDDCMGQIDGEDYEGEFRILLNGLRDWVQDWDHFDYGW